jgi:hypothetical protein
MSGSLRTARATAWSAAATIVLATAEFRCAPLMDDDFVMASPLPDTGGAGGVGAAGTGAGEPLPSSDSIQSTGGTSGGGQSPPDPQAGTEPDGNEGEGCDKPKDCASGECSDHRCGPKR